jgi:hypothetical protein
MPQGSPRRFWFGIAGLASVVIAGQVLWATLAMNSGGPPAIPIPVAKSLEMPKGSWRRIYESFPPLVDFRVESAEAVGSSILDDEYVLGVESEGESRAYPLNMLGRPGAEVVNDRLGGRPIAVTFCGLCETLLVFSRQLDDRTLTLYVSGTLVDGNMLIKDVETRSGWVQLLGKAVDGPLKGKELERLPATWTDWKTWRESHPSTTAIQLGRGTKRYTPASTEVGTSRRQWFLESLQWGLASGGKARSWPAFGLARERVANDSFDGRSLLVVFDPRTLGLSGFDRHVDGRELTFRWRGDDLVDDPSGSTWDPSTGRATRGPLEGRRLDPVAGTISTTAIWRAFHPQTEVWTPAGSPGDSTPEGGGSVAGP